MSADDFELGSHGISRHDVGTFFLIAGVNTIMGKIMLYYA